MSDEHILIINGPNLNLLGKREPDIYGYISFESYYEQLKNKYFSFTIDYFQSNIEGEIVNKIQEADNKYKGLILNPGGYSYTSIAIADAIRAINIPVIEVHISNIYAREEYRKSPITASVCKGIISGLGLEVYRLALEYLI